MILPESVSDALSSMAWPRPPAGLAPSPVVPPGARGGGNRGPAGPGPPFADRVWCAARDHGGTPRVIRQWLWLALPKKSLLAYGAVGEGLHTTTTLKMQS